MQGERKAVELFGLPVEVQSEERDRGGFLALRNGQKEMNHVGNSLGDSPAARTVLEVHFV
jgi:hypothetical protein